MPKTKEKSISFFAAFLIGLLSLSGFAFAAVLTTGNPMMALISQAKDGEDDGGGDDDSGKDDEDEDEDEDKDDDKGDDQEKEAEKQAKEVAKKKAEWQREQLKKKSELLRKQNETRRSFDDGDEDEEENEVEDENENEDSSKDDDKADILEDINGEIIDAEERIARAQAEGIDVTKALATLAVAKEKAAAAEKDLATTSYDALRSIAREVKKLAHFASHKDVKSSRDMQKDVDKIAKRISQAKGKIALYVNLGGDPANFNAALATLEGEFATLQENLAKGGQDQINALGQIDILERKVKRLKSSVEQAVYALGGTDERYDDDYENEVEDLYEDLNDVAEIEGDEVGQQIRTIAQAQKDSVNRVKGPVEALDKRNRILQFLVGTKTSEVEKLETEITANKARIEVLTQAASQIEDPEVKAILTEQINSLTQETSKLETFVSGQKDRLSAFGWLFNLFGN